VDNVDNIVNNYYRLILPVDNPVLILLIRIFYVNFSLLWLQLIFIYLWEILINNMF